MSEQLIHRSTPSIWYILELATTVLLILYFSGPRVPFISGLVNMATYGILAVLIASTMRFQRFAYVATRDIPLLILIVLTMISFVWSAAPSYTMDEGKSVLRAFLLGAYLAARYTPGQQMRLFGWAIGIGAVLSFVLTLGVPGYGIHGGILAGLWKGIYPHKQNLGRLMTLGFITFLCLYFNDDRSMRRRWIPAAGLILTLGLVLLSGSKTSLLIAIISASLFPLYRLLRQRYRAKVVLLTTALMVSISTISLVLLNIEFIVVDLLGKNLELSSRLPVWILAIEKAKERPWLGYGYSGFWTSDESAFILNSTWAGTGGTVEEGFRFHAHNGFIDVFLQLGLIGLILCAVTVFGGIWRSIHLVGLGEGMGYFWMFISSIYMFLFNTTEFSSYVQGGLYWMFTVSIILSTRLASHKASARNTLGLQPQPELS